MPVPPALPPDPVKAIDAQIARTEVHVRRSNTLVAAMLVMVMTAAVAAQRGAPSTDAGKLIGTWTGTWDGGGGSGGIEISIERTQDGPIGGAISITGDAEYKATLTAVSFEGSTMTVKYNYPPDESAEVILTAPVEGDSAAGTWSLREKASGNEVATGGWKATKKAR